MGQTTQLTVTCDRCQRTETVPDERHLLNWTTLEALGHSTHSMAGPHLVDSVLCPACGVRAVTS
jgi:hypothetical protein